MDLPALLDLQSGVVARRQLVELGFSDNDIRRLVRRRDLSRVHPGVFVDHTGPLSWVNRAWAAVLFYGDAVLCDVSALHQSGDVIHVAVDHRRTASRLPGVRVHRMRNLERMALWHTTPPRLKLEDAALDVAGNAVSLADAAEVLMTVCRERRTTPQRLLASLEQRARMPRGAELRAVLADAAAGVQSVLERSYVLRIERAHGLPRGRRQVRESTDAGVVYRDVLYEDFGVAVELEGWRWHETADRRSADLERDLAVAAGGRVVLRLSWRQVDRQPCHTASQIAAVLTARGWAEEEHPCGPRCVIAAEEAATG